MHVHHTHFYDSSKPWNIPTGSYAAVCINGAYAWRQSDIDRMYKVFRYIAVGGEAWWAAHARAVDIEPGCVWPPENAMPFLSARARHYGDATAYCDRSVLPQVQELCKNAGVSVLHWVATLDGTLEVPGAWAVQYLDDGRKDLSVLLGEDNFHAP